MVSPVRGVRRVNEALGVCPTCMARRVAETAAHLVDHVFPSLPMRQWVISFPKRLRYFLQRDPAVRSAALRVIEQALLEPSPGAGPEPKVAARIDAVAFNHCRASARLSWADQRAVDRDAGRPQLSARMAVPKSDGKVRSSDSRSSMP